MKAMLCYSIEDIRQAMMSTESFDACYSGSKVAAPQYRANVVSNRLLSLSFRAAANSAELWR